MLRPRRSGFPAMAAFIVTISAIYGCSASLNISTKSSSRGAAQPESTVDDGDVSGPDQNSGGSTNAKVGKPDCIDPDLSLVGSDQTVTMCHGINASGLLDLSELEEENIVSGQAVGTVTGTMVATPSACTADGQVGCLATNAFVAADLTGVSSTDIRVGKTIGGVTGSLADCTTDGESGCITNSTFPAVNVNGLTDSDVRSGVVIGGITGTGEFLDPCAADGATNCLTTASYAAIQPASVDNKKVRAGVSIGGVAGTKRDIHPCRNGGDLTLLDLPAPSNLPLNVSAVDFSADTLTLGAAHGAPNGYPVSLSTTGILPAPLVPATTYYVVSATTLTMQLAPTANGAAIDLSDAGSGIITIKPAGNGTVDIWDTLADYLGGTVSPAASPWDPSYLCGEADFIEPPVSPSLTPSGMVPVYGNRSWTKIYQDPRSGLYFTNILYDWSASTTTWSLAYKLCDGISSGDGAGKWRMPTLKEVLQLQVHGLAQLAGLGERETDNLWTSTTYTEFTDYQWTVYLPTGSSYPWDRRTYDSKYVLCVR